MKNKNSVILVVAMCLFWVCIISSAQETSPDPFLGMWALDLDYESSNAGWLEVRQEDGYLDAEGNPLRTQHPVNVFDIQKTDPDTVCRG